MAKRALVDEFHELATRPAAVKRRNVRDSGHVAEFATGEDVLEFVRSLRPWAKRAVLGARSV